MPPAPPAEGAQRCSFVTKIKVLNDEIGPAKPNLSLALSHGRVTRQGRRALRALGLGRWNKTASRSWINSHADNFLLNLLIFLLLHSGFLFKTHSFVPLTVSNCIKDHCPILGRTKSK